jgi:hypothetical protein
MSRAFTIGNIMMGVEDTTIMTVAAMVAGAKKGCIRP